MKPKNFEFFNCDVTFQEEGIDSEMIPETIEFAQMPAISRVLVLRSFSFTRMIPKAAVDALRSMHATVHHNPRYKQDVATILFAICIDNVDKGFCSITAEDQLEPDRDTLITFRTDHPRGKSVSAA